MYIMYNVLSFFICHQKPKTCFYPHSACLSGRPVPDGIFKCRGDDSQTDESHSQDDPINVNVKSKDILKLKISFLWWVRLCKALANEGKIKIKSNGLKLPARFDRVSECLCRFGVYIYVYIYAHMSCSCRVCRFPLYKVCV